MNVPFQPCPTVTPDGSVKLTYHSVSAVVPVFLMVTSDWKPFGQELATVAVAAQPPVPPPVDGVGVTPGLDIDAEADGEADFEVEGDGDADAGGLLPPVPPKFTSEQL